MKVFLDTNVTIEYLMRRERLDDAKWVIDKLIDGGHSIFMSAGGFYTILYVVDRYLHKELGVEKETRIAFLRNMARGLLHDYHIACQDNENLLQGIDDLRFVDLEDSCQLHTAIAANCQFLLTFNVKDYPSDDNQIEVLTPKQFLSKHLFFN